jgi:hypothetical protein
LFRRQLRTRQIDAVRISTAHGLNEIDGRNQMVVDGCAGRPAGGKR